MKKFQFHSEKTKKLISKKLKGYKRSEVTKRKISESRKGIKFSEDHINNLKKALKNRKPSFGMLGKKHSEETKQKMSNIQKGKKHKGYKLSDKYKKQRSNIRKGTHFSIATKQKMRKSRINYMATIGIKKKNTSIEIAIEQELLKRNIFYQKQISIENIAFVDFLLPNKIIIQCDGNYWHSRKINKGKDIAQDTELYFKGYKVFRFTETEIKKSPEKCIEKLF